MKDLKELRPAHRRIIQLILAKPRIKLKELARESGYSESHISRIIHTDAFQEKLAELNAEVDEALLTTVKDRLYGIAEKALARLEEKVAVTESFDEIERGASLALKNLGYGAEEETGERKALVELHVYQEAREQIGRTIVQEAEVCEEESERLEIDWSALREVSAEGAG